MVMVLGRLVSPDEGDQSVFNFFAIFGVSGQFFLQSGILIVCPDENQDDHYKQRNK